MNSQDLGWLQCTQCGHGHEVHLADVEATTRTGRRAPSAAPGLA